MAGCHPFVGSGETVDLAQNILKRRHEPFLTWARDLLYRRFIGRGFAPFEEFECLHARLASSVFHGKRRGGIEAQVAERILRFMPLARLALMTTRAS